MRPGELLHRVLSVLVLAWMWSHAPAEPTGIRRIRPDVLVGFGGSVCVLVIWFPGLVGAHPSVDPLSGEEGWGRAALVRAGAWLLLTTPAWISVLGPLVWRVLG